MTDVANPIDLPRRACTNCQKPLPEEIDELDSLVLSVIGLNRAGKTYFIGAALTAASRNEGLAEYGVKAFKPLDETATLLHRDYFNHLFRNKFGLEANKPGDHLERPPLMFRVTMWDDSAFILVVHDVAGESLMDRSLRAATASFVSRAAAVIFMADPTDMYQLARRLPPEEVMAAGGATRDLDQASLLETILGELRPEPKKARPPLALAISKSDLLDAALDRTFGFSVTRTTHEWKKDVLTISNEVRDVLVEIGEHKLVRLADEHQPSSYHAISVMGSEQNRKASGGRPVPVRVMDPLANILEELRRRRVSGD